MNQEKVSQLIKDIRKENNLTQQEFAKLFGVTYQAVSKWETGKNIPDIGILTDICNTYHYDIHNFLNGQKKKKSSSKHLFVIIIFILLLSFTFIYFFRDNTFTFKTIASNCNNFEITGSIAYNKEKTSIYISNISYCGEQKKELYQSINCSLYEMNGNVPIKINDFVLKDDKSQTLDELLKKAKFQIDDYNKTCKLYSENTLYLEISAFDVHGDSYFYKIPLKLLDNCDSTLS